MSVFTAHNIRLDDGSFTKPDLGWEMTQHPLMLAVIRLLEKVYPGGYRGKSIVDLGCLEGGYATEFARLGLEATGIEVRLSNFEKCLRVKDGVDLPNLRFVKDDAWNVCNYGPFDIVFCCGLLYHLDDPKRFLSMLDGVCRHLLVLDTQYSTEESSDAYQLSDLTVHEGLTGRWFTEYPPDSATEIEDASWAAWSNHRSFWPLHRDLIAGIKQAGFASVIELTDSRSSELIRQRTTLVAYK